MSSSLHLSSAVLLLYLAVTLSSHAISFPYSLFSCPPISTCHQLSFFSVQLPSSLHFSSAFLLLCSASLLSSLVIRFPSSLFSCPTLFTSQLAFFLLCSAAFFSSLSYFFVQLSSSLHLSSDFLLLCSSDLLSSLVNSFPPSSLISCPTLFTCHQLSFFSVQLCTLFISH